MVQFYGTAFQVKIMMTSMMAMITFMMRMKEMALMEAKTLQIKERLHCVIGKTTTILIRLEQSEIERFYEINVDADRSKDVANNGEIASLDLKTRPPDL